MRYGAVDPQTGLPLANVAGIPAGQKLSYKYFPRIRCLDCPGKLYTPGPAMTVENFEVHLKNRQHKERVEERHARQGNEAPTATVRASGSASDTADGGAGNATSGPGSH